MTNSCHLILWLKHNVTISRAKKYRSWQDSNLQSPDPKSGALSIRPHNLRCMNKSQYKTLLCILASCVAIKGAQQASEFTQPICGLSQALKETFRYARVTCIKDSPSVLKHYCIVLCLFINTVESAKERQLTRGNYI